MAAEEAKARIKINKLLEESGWRFFDRQGGWQGQRLFQEIDQPGESDPIVGIDGHLDPTVPGLRGGR